ncbi:hypothetical protein C8J57DRAFT_1595417 [Mycena rebaudengoi]|nr:hypothetical protein C8J57DRAFT_1595417 [Mycena rebaudengoi]
MEDPDEEMAELIDPDKDAGTEEETEARKIGQWYRYNYRKLVANNAGLTASFIDGDDADMRVPRKVWIDHFYSKMFYESRIREHYKVRGVPCRGNRRVSGLLGGHEVRRAHKGGGGIRESAAAGGGSALKHAVAMLQPFADAVAKQYGMPVSILLVGPIGRSGGNIEVRRSGRLYAGDKLVYEIRHVSILKSVMRVPRSAEDHPEPLSVPTATSGLGLGLGLGLGSTPSGPGASAAAASPGSAGSTPSGPNTSTTDAGTGGVEAPGAGIAALSKWKEKREGKKKEKEAAAAATAINKGQPQPRPKHKGMAAGGEDDDNDELEELEELEELAHIEEERTRRGEEDEEDEDNKQDEEDKRDEENNQDKEDKRDEESNQNPKAMIPSWTPRGQVKWPEEMRRIYASCKQHGLQWGDQWELAVDVLCSGCGEWDLQKTGEKGGQTRFNCKPLRRGGLTWTWQLCLVDDFRESRAVSHAPMFWVFLIINQQADGGLDRQGEFEWGGMQDHAERNGLVQVVLVLMWWGCSLKFGGAEGAEHVLDWELAVDEPGVKGGFQKRGVMDKDAPIKTALTMGGSNMGKRLRSRSVRRGGTDQDEAEGRDEGKEPVAKRHRSTH